MQPLLRVVLPCAVMLAAVPSVASPTARDAQCARTRESRDRVIAALERARPAAGPDVAGLVVPDILGTCVGGAGSRWAYALEDARFGPNGYGQIALNLRWSLMHDGAREARVRPAMPATTAEDKMPDLTNDAGNLRIDMFDTTSFAPPDTFDWDKDGDPEIVVYESTHRHEAGTWSHGRVWTFRGGRLDLYPAASAISVIKVEDVDGDGRPDLWTHGPYSAHGVSYGAGFDISIAGPPLLAHARADGTFSMDDAIAVAADRRACAHVAGAMETPLSDPVVTSEMTGATYVVCARLAGDSAEKVLARIDRDCPVATTRPGTPCDNAQIWRDFARARPPFLRGAR